MTEYKAFLCCSIHEEDEGIVNIFEYVLKAHGFKCVTVGKSKFAPEPPPITIRREVKSSDCLFVVATSHDNLGNISEYLKIEPAMAFFGYKPVGMFASKNVKAGSFLPAITQMIKFDAKNPLKDKEKIDQYIRSIKRRVQQQRHAKYLAIKKQQDKEFWDAVGKVLLGIAAFGAGAGTAYLLTREKKKKK